jgi:hypothetical protein
VKPPSAHITWPVMNDARCDSKKLINSAISFG